MKRLFCFVLMLFFLGSTLVVGSAGKAQSVAPFSIQPLQVKACERSPVDGYIGPCTFDNPVQPGSLLIQAALGNCDPTGTPPTNCLTTADNQGNEWHDVKQLSGNTQGNSLGYALNAKGGIETVFFTRHVGYFAIIAEYPASTGLDDASWGDYDITNYDQAVGASNTVGFTQPIKTTQSCDLLISWGNSGSYELNALHPDHVPSSGPYFTVRESEYGILGLEDSTAPIPGLYIGVMDWNTAAHWHLGIAAFKMASCGQ